MKTRTKYVVGIIASIPFVLMADSIFTEQFAISASEAGDNEPFQVTDLVPTESAGLASSYYSVPPQPY